jgi:[acyl-carrier-protein] S-malonyltransferase
MEPVRAKFKPYLDGVDWKTPAFPVCFNVDAEVKQDPDIKALLTEQIDHPVLWTSCVLSLRSYGVERFIEPGPGKVLTGLGKRITKDVETINVESAADITALQKGGAE